MLLAGVRDLLANNAGVAQLVGDRIRPIVLPEGSELPALTYQRVGGSTTVTFQSSGLQKVRMQVDCWGSKAVDADALQDAVRKALDGFQGALSDGTYLQGAQFIQVIDFFNSDSRLFRLACEFYLFFNFTP